MRVRVSMAASLGCLALAVPSAALAAPQGDAVTPGGSYNGTRATTSGSGSPKTPGQIDALIGIQSSQPNSFVDSVDGLIQVGEINGTSTYTGDCGTGINGIMVEHKSMGGYYFCNPFFGTFGSTHRFAVVRVSSGWQAYEDGSVIDGPYSLGFSSGYSVLRGEYHNLPPLSYSFTWGPSGGTAWQVSTDQGSSYSTVLSSTAQITPNSNWFVGSAPSPLVISH